MQWARPEVLTASSPYHFARNQTFVAFGSAPAPEQYTNLRAPAPAAARTSRSVPWCSNSSKVNRLRGFSIGKVGKVRAWIRSEEHTSELQSHHDLVCRLLLEKKKKKKKHTLTLYNHTYNLRSS